MTRTTANVLCIALLFLAGCRRADPPAAGQGPLARADGQASHEINWGPDPIVTHFSQRVQLFMEYPQLVRGQEARFLAHVTVLETGEPVRSGTLRLELAGADGTTLEAVAEQPSRDGLFVPVLVPQTTGSFTGRIGLSSPQVEDRFEFGTVTVHADEAAALAAAEAAGAEGTPDAIPFLLEQQWKTEFRLERAARRSLFHRLTVPGSVEAATGRSAAVCPPMAGRLLAPAPGSLPKPGDPVEAGGLLAFIEPPLNTMLQIEQAVAEAATRLRFASRTCERITGLREKGLGTDGQLEEADRDLRIAQLEHARACRLRAAFGAEDPGAESLAEPAAPLAIAVTAPISGTIVHTGHIEGEYVDASDVLCRITDMDVVWVRGQVSEFDLAQLSDAPRAVLSLPALPDRVLDVSEVGGYLVNIGSVIDPATRTLPIIYELRNPGGLLRIGMLVDLHLETRRAASALAIPESAVVLDAGRPTAYVLLDGEHFERRELVLGVRDGGYVEVGEGIDEGEWVVARGGNTVRLASLSPASFGHGHAH